MVLRSKKYLNIVLMDYNHNDADIFKAVSSINNQIGFDVKNDISISLITDRLINYNWINETIFNDLEVDLIKCENKNYYTALNNIIKLHEFEWVTFIDSRDLFFADGSLLDFIHYSEVSKDDHDIFIFKYISPTKINNRISRFKSNQFTNIIFGKYFKVDFLMKNEIFFNGKLNYYLFDDFSSKAMKLCDNAIWYDLINYYLYPREYSKEPAMEFINYRIEFICFLKKHINGSIFTDITWSIVQAFSMLKKQNLLNNDYKYKMKILYEFTNSYNDYDTLLSDQFESQLGNINYFNEFIEFIGV